MSKGSQPFRVYAEGNRKKKTVFVKYVFEVGLYLFSEHN